MTDTYVWAWLPGSDSPVVAGRVRLTRGTYDFRYGESYLDRTDAVPLYRELPLIPGVQRPLPGLEIAGVLLDALPDSWGRRVIHQRASGARGRDADPLTLPLETYMLQSASDRVGGLDFQQSPTDYQPRGTGSQASMDDLLDAADRMERGLPLPPEVADALMLGSTVGGARPKALVYQDQRPWIAKFPSATDLIPAVRHEALTMSLARRVGLAVAVTDLVTAAGRDVLLVERFDRPADGTRRMQVSALTVLGQSPDAARGTTSYPALADSIRTMFDSPRATLAELFGRLVFNVVVRNTDDHARNHAAFWDGRQLALTPAYDITPSVSRRDTVVTHPMAITPDGRRESLLASCVSAAAVFQLSRAEAQDVVDSQVAIVHDEWRDIAEQSRLTRLQQDALWQTSILNPAIFWPEE